MSETAGGGAVYILVVRAAELLDRAGKWRAAGPIPIRVATWPTGPTNRTSSLVDRPSWTSALLPKTKKKLFKN